MLKETAEGLIATNVNRAGVGPTRRLSRNRPLSTARHRALRSARPSPARSQAPEPGVWFPVPDMAGLPELEELLKPENLVDSGQVPAISLTENLAALPAEIIEAPFTMPEGGMPELAPAPEVSKQHAAPASAYVHTSFRALAIVCAVILTVLALPILLWNPNRAVALSADGHVQTVRTSAHTVGGVLHSQHIVLGPFDLVSPSQNSKLHAHERITILRAVPVTVDDDGVMYSVLTAHTNPQALRKQMGLSSKLVAKSAHVTSKAPVVFRAKRHFSLTMDGTTKSFISTALTPEELLADRSLALSPTDEITPPRGSRLADGTHVSIIRITDDTRTADEPIPAPVQYRNDATMAAGQQKVLQPGAPGVARQTIQMTRRDGNVVAENVVSVTTITEPKPRVIAKGTKTSSAPAASSSTSHTETGQATWYGAPAGTCAHKTIAKGTVLTVVNLANGQSTTCTVADRGPFGAGRIVDLSQDTFEHLASGSAGVLNVRIEW